MGIDIHNLNFMAHAADLGVRFDASIGIGRQAVFIDDWMLARHRAARGLAPLRELPPVVGAPVYFEPMLQQWFGARVVDSVDASAYEQARLIHDMNLPWPADGPLAAERGRFDAVLDFGCLEHVFDFPVAWRNCVELCRVGGHLLHALPANNLAGHGFYQFSPELFFNLYRPERGFELQALYVALKADPSRWWQVANPRDLGRRVNLRNSHEVYLLVLARKLRETAGPLPAPQQSDYAEQAWQAPVAGTAPPPPRSRQAIAARLAALGLIDIARSVRERLRAIRTSGFELPAPDYRRLDVEPLIRRTANAAA